MTSAAAIWAPVRLSDGASWLDYFELHRGDYMAPQVQSWTCSACSIDWVARATALDPHSTREQVVAEMGYPDCINPEVGLTDTRCAVNYMERWGVEAIQQWCDFTTAHDLCSGTTGLLNSVTWQHFVAIRGVQGDNIWIANSAPGYRGIWDTISRAQWDAWAGSWQIVWLVP